MIDKKLFPSIDEYIKSQPNDTQKTLRDVYNCILQAAPDAIEMFNYNIPAFALVKGGKREEQIMVAGYKNHVGFYPHPTTIEYFESELSPYKKGKGSVQFQNGEPIPRKLIIQMVKYRLKLVQEKKNSL